MKDCEKIFLVFYLRVENVCSEDMDEYLLKASNALKSGYDDSVNCIFIPLYEGGDSRVEVINPRYISEDEYKKLTEKVNKYLDDFNSHKK